MYVSPLTRCTQTCDIIYKTCGSHTPPQPCQLITEVNWGTWEGKTYEEALGTYDFKTMLPHHMNPPGGENLFSVVDRGQVFLDNFINSS